MLEDCSVMEKKPNGRSVQPPPKAGGGTENKKSVDTNNKPFGKYSRRRESSGYNNSKNEPLRKSNPYKGGKFADKRPRPRNQYYGCGKEDSKVVENEGPEYGSVFVPGSKKQNLNHLLNFHYLPITTSGSSERCSRNAPHNWFATQKHKYNKEHFLQANCQFVVKENADYSQHFVDPDLLVDWDRIEQVRLQTNAVVSCPVCLDTPVASKITRCGHVYCWSCILHYLALSDKSWRKCPICFEAVHKNDLKSVITLAYAPYKLNEEITFKLMKRERGSLLPIPMEECSKKTITGLLSFTETEINTVYSKLLLANSKDVLSIIQMERMELKAQALENAGCPEICFIEQALELLNEREEQITNSLEEVNNTEDTSQKEFNTGILENNLIKEFNSNLLLHGDQNVGRTRYESISSEGGTTSEEDHANIAAEDLEVKSNNTSTKPYYFYQASDGQHVYLHSLNIKMLEMQYGSLERSPLQVCGKIIEKEVGSMTENLRKRLRYLQHLPLTCQFEVVEINLSPYVSDEVLDYFKDQIEVRIKRRNRRAREERRREKKINEESNLKWGRRPTPKIRIESHRQFPLCGSSSDEVLTVFPPSPPESNVSRSQSLNSLSSVSTTLDTASDANSANQFFASSSLDCGGPSFAQMLKEGTGVQSKYKAHSSSTPRKEQFTNALPIDSENELDGYVSVPHFRQSFSDAIAVALEKAEHAQEDTSSKKKKKKKQKVLFVTGMACSAK